MAGFIEDHGAEYAVEPIGNVPPAESDQPHDEDQKGTTTEVGLN
jgi:hypothetical protein